MPDNDMLEDSFFDLSKITSASDLVKDMSFDKGDVRSIENEVDSVISESELFIDPPTTQKQQPPQKQQRTKSQAQPTGRRQMENEDPIKRTHDALLDDFSNNDENNVKLMAYRMEPQVYKGTKISGFLESIYLPTSISEVTEKIQTKYGGGKYQIKMVDGAGKYLKSKIVEVAGFPKIPDDQAVTPAVSTVPPSMISTNTNQTTQQQPQPAAPNPVFQSAFQTSSFSSDSNKGNKDEEEDDPFSDSDDDDDDSDDYIDEDNYSSHRLKPKFRHEEQSSWNRDSFNQNQRINPIEEMDKVKKDLEAKLDAKLDKFGTMMSNTLSSAVAAISSKKEEPKSLITPEIIRAGMPLLMAFLENRQSKDNTLVTQFQNTNDKFLSLFEGIKDITRSNEKSREELINRERNERESLAKHLAEIQEKSESRMQDALKSFQESIVKRYESEATLESKMRAELEKVREESRRKDEEARENRRLEEIRIREEARAKDEQARLNEMKWREELRIKELEAERASRAKELEMVSQFRNLELQKIQSDQKSLEQIYREKIGSSDDRLKIQLEMAKLSSENEMRAYQATSNLALEKLRHEAQMTVNKLKSEVDMTRAPVRDPIEEALADHLRKRTRAMMFRELDLEEETQSSEPSFGDLLKVLISQGSKTLEPMLRTIFPGSPQPVEKPAQQVQAARPAPAPAQNPAPQPQNTQDTQEQAQEESQNNEDLATQIAELMRVFAYLKEAIIKSDTPEKEELLLIEAVKVMKTKLPEKVLAHLKSIPDCTSITSDLKTFFDSSDPTLSPFFDLPKSKDWLNKLLAKIKD